MIGIETDRRGFLALAGTSAWLLLRRRAVLAGVEIRVGLVSVPGTPTVASLRRGLDLGVEEAERTARLFGGSFSLLTAEATDRLSAEAAVRALASAGATIVVTVADGDVAWAVAAEAARRGALFVGLLPSHARGCRAEAVYVAPSVAEDALLWHRSLERFGAAQVNDRYRARHDGSGMDGAAWAGWFAMKAVAEAALRARSVEPGALRRQLLRQRFDGHKGRPLTFDHNGMLTQPLYELDAEGRASELPRPPESTRASGCPAAGALALALALLPLPATLAAQAGTGAPATELLWVSNEESRDVSVVRASDLRLLARIPVGERPRGIQASPDGSRIYVALSDEHPQVESGRDAIAVIDARTRRLVARYAAGTDPEQFAVAPDGRRLYSANEDAGTASVTDLGARKVLATVVVGIEPEGVAISPDGRWVYITAETSNSVSVLDTRTNRIVANMLVDVRPRGVAFAPDGKRAYVSAEIGSSLSVVDVARHEVIETIPLEDGAGKPVGVVVSRDGRRVYVANGATHHVAVVDAASHRVLARIPVGRRPWGVALSPDGKRLYTANGLTNDVSVIDTATNRVVGTVRVGTRPWGVAVTR